MLHRMQKGKETAVKREVGAGVVTRLAEHLPSVDRVLGSTHINQAQ